MTQLCAIKNLHGKKDHKQSQRQQTVKIFATHITSKRIFSLISSQASQMFNEYKQMIHRRENTNGSQICRNVLFFIAKRKCKLKCTDIFYLLVWKSNKNW